MIDNDMNHEYEHETEENDSREKDFNRQTMMGSLLSNVEPGNIDIDAQYGLITTKIELSIIFGIFAPFLFLIAAASAVSNFYAYYVMLNKLPNARIVGGMSNPVPVKFIFCSVVFQQFLVIVFCQSFFHQWILFCMIALFVLSDILYCLLPAVNG